jgi:hypothetical protein
LERNKENGLPSPITSHDAETNQVSSEVAGFVFSSPSRKVRTRWTPDILIRPGS